MNLLILSDRGVDADLAPIPALLATAAVHHHLIREETRTKCGLLVETGEAREVGHFALLIGYSAGAVNPYLAFNTVRHLIEDGRYIPEDLTLEKALENYIKAVDKGLLKIFAKMGISTLQSYRGAQIFEAVGLSKDLVARYFTGTPSKVSGVGIDVIARSLPPPRPGLSERGRLLPRARSGRSLPVAAAASATASTPTLSRVCSTPSGRRASRRSRESRRPPTATRARCTRRVCSASGSRSSPCRSKRWSRPKVVKRSDRAMSLGSISREGHENVAHRHESPGWQSNTGESGEDPERFTPDENGDLRRSAIKQAVFGRSGRHQLVSSTPTRCRSRWRRARSPAREASFRVTRSTTTSPASGTGPRGGPDLTAAASRHSTRSRTSPS